MLRPESEAQVDGSTTGMMDETKAAVMLDDRPDTFIGFGILYESMRLLAPIFPFCLLKQGRLHRTTVDGIRDACIVVQACLGRFVELRNDLKANEMPLEMSCCNCGCATAHEGIQYSVSLTSSEVQKELHQINWLLCFMYPLF